MRKPWAGALRYAATTAFAMALALASPSSVRAAGPAEDYQLAPGDGITVTVFGQPQLSAKLTIDGSGNVVVPFLGAVRVADLSVAQIQQLIQSRLADGFLKNPLVSVAIDQLRPIYILGDVRKPGAYPFRYGSTVESAVAVAGGYGAPGLREGAAVSEYLAAEEHLRQLASEQLTLQVREARLDAERGGRASFAMPAPDAADQRKLAKLAAEEQAMLSSETEALGTEIRLLETQKPRLQQRILAIGQQIATDQKQLQFVKDEEQRSVRLLNQGLGVRGPEVQMKLEETNVQNNIYNLNAELSHSQLDLGNLDLEIEKAQAAFKKQTLDELGRVRSRLASIAVELPSAWAIRNVKMQEVEGAAAAMQTKYEIQITRNRAGHVEVIKASATTPLQPGDTIDVKAAVSGRSLGLPSPTG